MRIVFECSYIHYVQNTNRYTIYRHLVGKCTVDVKVWNKTKFCTVSILVAVVIAGGWGSKLTDVDSVTSAVVVVVVVVDVKEEGSWSSSYGPNYQKSLK